MVRINRSLPASRIGTSRFEMSTEFWLSSKNSWALSSQRIIFLALKASFKILVIIVSSSPFSLATPMRALASSLKIWRYLRLELIGLSESRIRSAKAPTIVVRPLPSGPIKATFWRPPFENIWIICSTISRCGAMCSWTFGPLSNWREILIANLWSSGV